MTRRFLAPVRPEWMDEADCASIGSDWWYPHARDDLRGGVGRQAKAICGSCPVRLECLEYALKLDESWGIWGGLTPGERSRIPRDVPLTADLLDRLE